MFEKPIIARILLQLGADTEYTTPGGWSIPHYLFDRGRLTANTELYSLLHDDIMFDNCKDLEGWTALHRCAAFGTAEDVHFLYSLGLPKYLDRCITDHGWTPIHIAALMDNVSSLEALADLYKHQGMAGTSHLDALHSVDRQGWTPLHLAVERGAKATLRWLLQNGADPHRRTYRTAAQFPEGHEGEAFTAVDLAKLCGTESLRDFVELLREAGYDIMTDGVDVFWP